MRQTAVRFGALIALLGLSARIGDVRRAIADAEIDSSLRSGAKHGVNRGCGGMTALRAYVIFLRGIAIGVAAFWPLIFGLTFCAALFQVGFNVTEAARRLDYSFLWGAYFICVGPMLLWALGAAVLLDSDVFSERVRSISEAEWKSVDLRHKVIGESLRIRRRRH
ncbi:MAG: hypothetical protein NT015_13785 [Alphaproteobacteria bacterium]|nr:hypothetical protein [Alphaproteobacteria bacterium]